MNLIFTLPSHLFEIRVNLFFYVCLGFSGALRPLSFLLVKEGERSAYFVEGASSYVPISTVAPRNVSHVYATTGRWDRGFKYVPKYRSTFVFCAPVILYREQHFDWLCSVQGALQISINNFIEPGSDIIWDTLSCTARQIVKCRCMRTTFKEFWRENLKDGERLNPF
jgi:hypothetical protein